MFKNAKTIQDIQDISERNNMDVQEYDISAYPIVYRTFRFIGTTDCIVVKYRILEGTNPEIEYLGEYKETI